MRRTIAVVLIVAGIVLLTANAFAFALNERSETTNPRGTITRVLVQNENGDVSIRPGDATRVTREERWNFVRPDYSERVSDETLIVKADCSSMLLNNCSVELSLVVPKSVDVVTETLNGDVSVTEITGDSVRVSSTNGDLTFVGLASDVVDAGTTNGDVTLTDVESRTVSSTTTNGDIEVELGTRPDSVTLESKNGDIDAVLPKGDYDIETATTNGDVSVEGLDDDPESPRSVSARTTNGDIDLSAG